MMKRKAVLVTVLIVVMLVIIDAFLWKQSKSGFFLLTGMITLYGGYRIAVDFCDWLCRPDKPQEARARFSAQDVKGGKRA